ncbi:MAG: DUF2339 domain-containing protein [Chloroflexota bacterium]|nr:DUF2339 domain-containing protein [Chloroflexota bacterium]
MDTTAESALNGRLARLEDQVADLGRTLDRVQWAVAAVGIRVPEPAAPLRRPTTPLAPMQPPRPTRPVPVAPPPPAVPAQRSGPLPLLTVHQPSAPPPAKAAPSPQPIAVQPQQPAAPPPPPRLQPAPPAPVRAAAPVAAAAEPARSGFDVVRITEFWLNKVAIALLLFGVALLLNWANQQGWVARLITPPIIVSAGYAIGLGLLAFGLRLYEDRPHFSQVLLGGAVGVFYITTYGAWGLLHLLEAGPALGVMIAVTLTAFALAVRQNVALLSLIGTIGALLTPFVIQTGDNNLPGLVLYTCCVLAGTGAIYFRQGWHSLLWTAWVGGWAVLAVACFDFWTLPDHPLAVRLAVQMGIGFAWLVGWAIPVLRNVVWAAAPDQWQQPTRDLLADLVPPAARRRIDPHVHLITVLTAGMAACLSSILWAGSDGRWSGPLLVAGALVYAAVYRLLREREPALAYTHIMMALLLLTLALTRLFGGDLLLITLAAEVAALHFIAIRVGDRGLTWAGHALAVPVAAALVLALAADPYGLEMGTTAALSQWAVIAALAAATLAQRRGLARTLYNGGVHLATLILLTLQLVPLAPAGEAVALGWMIYALGALAWARYHDDDLAAGVGHGLFALLAPWFGWRLLLGHALSFSWDHGLLALTRPGEWPIVNLMSLTDLALIAALVGAAWLSRHSRLTLLYLGAAHQAMLLWLWREGSGLPAGGDAVLLAWAGYAAVLYLFAQRRTDRGATPDPLARRLTWAVHSTCASLGGLLAGRLVFGYALGTLILSLAALADLLVIGLLLVVGRGVTEPRLAGVYRVAGILVALGFAGRELWLIDSSGGLALLVWAAAAAALHWAAQRHEDRALRVLGHSVFAVVVPWLMVRLLSGMTNVRLPFPVVNLAAVINLTVIGLLFISVRRLPSRQDRLLYRLAGHGAVLAWIGHEFLFLSLGTGPAVLAWACYAMLLEYYGGEDQPEVPDLVHGIFAGLGLLIAARFWNGPADALPIFNVNALGAGGALMLAGVVAARSRSQEALWTYRTLIHAGVLALLWHELGGLPQGNGLITVTWAVYALLILIVGLRRTEVGLIYGAVGTLLLVVGKLFLIDLVALGLDLIWRSLLFIGFGIAFLLLSYYLQSWLKRAPQV